MQQINPELAADLARPTDEQLAADLSKDAIAARKRQHRLVRAAAWARTMNRTFKGIRGAPNRRGYVRRALMRDPMLRKEAEGG